MKVDLKSDDKVDLQANKKVPAPPARNSTTTTAPAAAGTATLSGVVVDPSGRPEAGVSVRAITYVEHEPVAQSDAAGRFEIRVDRGRARGLALLARSADGARQGFLRLNSFDVQPLQTPPPIRMTMSPARSIDVQVVDGSGRPVADAVVGAVAAYTAVGSGYSDQQGKLTLRVPANTPLQSIYALKSGIGLDYLSVPEAERAPRATSRSRPI